jgi:hypothetical protein
MAYLTEKETIEELSAGFDGANECVVATLPQAFWTSSVFLTLIFVDMASDGAPVVENAVWICVTILIIPPALYVWLHRDWFKAAIRQSFCSTPQSASASE